MTENEVECQIGISEFIRTLSRNQQKDFANVMNSITECYYNSNIKPLCSLPTQYADIRRMYVDGNVSVTRNLPIPNIMRLKNHSYVSVSDCIADFLLSNNLKTSKLVF